MAIEAEALLDALRLALKFVDRSAGEGIFFEADGDTPAMDAADVCIAVSEALGIDFAGPEYSAFVDGGPLPSLIHRSALAEDTARAAEGQIPEGWKLVPVKPTEEMLCAIEDAGKSEWAGTVVGSCRSLYAAMIAAAPKANGIQTGEEGMVLAPASLLEEIKEHLQGLDVERMCMESHYADALESLLDPSLPEYPAPALPLDKEAADADR